MKPKKTSKQTAQARPSKGRSLWDSPFATWKRQLPDRKSFRNPKVSSQTLRDAVRTEDTQSREFATPVTAEALTYTFG
jgi:hypothetical protein